METQTAGRFKCAACGATYRWKPEWAGRSVKCRCTHVMVCPTEDPALIEQAPEEDLYDVADDTPIAAKATPTVARTSQQLSTMTRPLEYRAPAAYAAPADLEENKVRDLWMPLWLIAGAMLIEICGVAIRMRGQSPGAILTAMGLLFGGIVITTVVLLGGILLAARLRGLNLGPFWTAVLKLTAISVAPAAVQTLLTPVFMILLFVGALISWIVGFVVYFALIGALFDLDQSDTWFCIMIIFLVKVGLVIAVVVGGLSLLAR